MFTNLTPSAVGIRADLDQTIRLAGAHGFEGIDLPIEEVARSGDPDACDARRQAANLRWGGFAFCVDHRRDDATYQQGMAMLRKWAPIAAQLGCKRTYTFIMPGHDELAYDANFKHHVDRLKPAVEVLAGHDIRLGLEFIGPKTLRDTFRHPFIYTIGQMLELCRALGESHVGVLLDSFHWYTSGGTEADLLDQLNKDNIVYVHVNDGYHGRSCDEQLDPERALPCETGVIDSATFVRALRTLQYDGPVTAEPFVAEFAEQPADEVTAKVSRSIQKMLALAPS